MRIKEPKFDISQGILRIGKFCVRSKEHNLCFSGSLKVRCFLRFDVAPSKRIHLLGTVPYTGKSTKLIYTGK